MSFALAGSRRLGLTAVLGTTALVGLSVQAEAAQHAMETPLAEPSGLALYDRVCGSASEAEVVVCGRRSTDRYRLPVDMRGTTQRYRDNRRAVLDSGIECRNVGPQGCGLKPLPIITIGSDGQITIGDPDGTDD